MAGTTKLTISQVKSPIGSPQNQRNTLRSLGLKRIGDTVTHDDKPEIRGMIKAVDHLVVVSTDGEG